MDFLEPRKAYHRTPTDDIELKSQASSVQPSPSQSQCNFKTGFSNTIRDESPLLDSSVDVDPIRREPAFFSRDTFRSLKLPFVIWPTHLYGWRTGALTAALLAAISLLINFGVVVFLGAHGHGDGLVELYNGNCSKVSRVDLWVHLAINVLSTLLLGGSNYCMQCLCAPTRKDVDRAHLNGRFLDIGVPSVRNLRRIPLYKMGLWWALGLSSVPLHLMYNSAFYKSLAANDYNIYVVTQDFVDGQPLGQVNSTVYNGYSQYQVDPANIQTSLLENPASWERLDKKACIQSYATSFLASRRSLILVSNNATNDGNSNVLDMYMYLFDSTNVFYWICNSDAQIRSKLSAVGYEITSIICESYVDRIVSIADQWQPYDYDVDYCLSERVQERCTYTGNVPIVAVILLCNAVKVVVMLFVAFRLKDSPLITVGDAVESFLNSNDKTTQGLCLLTKKDVLRAVQSKKHWSVLGQERYGEMAVGQLASKRRRLWASSASGWRWFTTMCFILLAIIVSSVLYSMAALVVHRSGFSIKDIGFGKVTPISIISGWGVGVNGSDSSKILSSILIANLPQTILSFLYLNLNGLLTTMWLAREWSDFATQRKTLRVSKPQGIQRSTHFLQLPYKIALPLMVLAGLLHWLLSQSIFLAVIAEYDPKGELNNSTAIASCGFSPLAILSVIALGVLLIVATLMVGFLRRYDGSIPLAGSCSAAVAAACHQPGWDADASLKAVQWGAIPDVMDSRGVGHCAFSSGKVESVVDGKEYAGTPDGVTSAWMRRRRDLE